MTIHQLSCLFGYEQFPVAESRVAKMLLGHCIHGVYDIERLRRILKIVRGTNLHP